ncbi:putative acetyltransferase domain protein [Mycobacterium xenopi 4042]|uniref:Putative acetyltransferase domain protein n=1 Tax=Mycobacterium xenopi 4042 TaxID=1299334 RepID=X7YNZ9_MYCXE|nr:putative acetyltransferase domain protein [Mycobacterium xenopi 4042]
MVPVGATVLMILAGANRHADPGAGGRMPLPNRVLAAGPLVTLGGMAYSLYLWHWPLLIFWLAYTGHRRANFVEGTAVLVISGVLAYFTMRYVEDPLRYRARPTRWHSHPRCPGGRGCAGPRWRWARWWPCWASP